MANIEWHKWKSKNDNPLSGRDIIVRRKDGKIVFAYYEDNIANLYMAIIYRVNDGTMTTYCHHDGFREGDEWIYVEQLKGE